MWQIVYNIAVVFVIPPLLGLTAALLLRKWKYGWAVAAGSAAVALGMYLYATRIFHHGSEGPGLMACMSGLFAAGFCLFWGLYRFLCHVRKTHA